MHMTMLRILIGFALSLVMSSATVPAFAQSAQKMAPPPPIVQLLGLSGICVDQQYLYVMAGGKIIQYEISDLKLIRAVDLPELPPPPKVSPKETGSSQLPAPPPQMAAPHGLSASEGFLYVLAGPLLFRYSTPDLTLQNSVELPRPKLPQAGN
jgi:hypothetical protein